MSDGDDNLSGSGGGSFVNPAVTATIARSIVGENLSNASADDCDGSLTSADYNLLSDVGGRNLIGSMKGNITGVSPELNSLTSVVGSPTTLGNLPLPGGPVIDPEPSSGCAANDQRDVPRPIDGDGNSSAICDIGAIEYAFEAFFDGVESGDTSAWSDACPDRLRFGLDGSTSTSQLGVGRWPPRRAGIATSSRPAEYHAG